MGILTKLKDIFYDPIDPEEEQEKEKEVKEPKLKIRVKEDSKKIKEVPEEAETIEFEPTIEIKKVKDEVINEVKTENTYTERELFRNERTFNFTEFDDEEDKPQRPTALDMERRTSRVESAPVIEEKPKMFKPSPVISPIYGILDKDYNKEDIVERKPAIKEETDHRTTYDVVRRKAYGTLEDTLTDTMITTPEEVKESVDDIEEEMDKLNDKTAKIEDLINRIDKADTSITIGELEDRAKDEEFKEEKEEELEKTREFNDDVDDKTITDDTLEHDLFNLIDSMYDDKEE